MRLSFDDEESFKGAVESLRFNNPSSDPNVRQQLGSITSMPLEDSQRNEDNIISSDLVTVRPGRVGSSSGPGIQEIRGSGDPSFFDNPPSNPELEITSANEM